MNKFVVYGGNTTKDLTQRVCDTLKCEQGSCTLSTFSDGEMKIKIHDSVRDKCVFVIQSITSYKDKSVNDMLMELYLFIRTLKRASAAKVIVIIPYFGYSRQDRKTEPRVPISASDIAMMLETAGADRIVAFELHCGQIQGFFRSIPCDNIYSSCLFAEHFVMNQSHDNLVVVSPDAGGVTRAKLFKEKLASVGVSSGFAIIVKERSVLGAINNMSLVGDVKNKDVVIVDDICDTGGTLIKAIEQLKEFGANHIYACITHPVFSCDAIEKIEKSPIDKMFVCDTIELKRTCSKITTVQTHKLLSTVVDIFVSGGSINELFKNPNIPDKLNNV